MDRILGFRKEYRYSFKGILFRLCLFLAMMTIMRLTAFHVGQLSGGQGILDLCVLPTPSFTATALSRFSGKALLFYRWVFFAVDLVYVLSYCTFYRYAIQYLMQKGPVSANIAEKLAFMPIIGGISDLLENSVLFLMLGMKSYPVWICVLFLLFNTVKYLFVYTSLGAVICGILYRIKYRKNTLT